MGDRMAGGGWLRRRAKGRRGGAAGGSRITADLACRVTAVLKEESQPATGKSHENRADSPRGWRDQRGKGAS
jgi:hypothetical protein